MKVAIINILFLLLLFPCMATAQLAKDSADNEALFARLEEENAKPRPDAWKDVEELFPESSYISDKPILLTPQEKEALRLAREWDGKAIRPSMTADGKVTYVFGASVPTLVCAPMQLSDLELQQGEAVNSIVLGDSARWQVDIVHVGDAEDITTPHVVFKPVDAGLETSAVITTDRRAYHVKLKSRKQGHTPYSGFLYMNEIRNHLASAQRKIEKKEANLQEAARFHQLDFSYVVEGDVKWKPQQVYNDGVKTYIRMPGRVAQGEMPVLLVETSSGEALVNYRIRSNTYVVDQLFDRGLLVVGVDDAQERVSIQRTEVN